MVMLKRLPLKWKNIEIRKNYELRIQNYEFLKNVNYQLVIINSFIYLQSNK